MSAETTTTGHRVLVGVDGASGSTGTIRYAATEARRVGTGLHLVHVVADYAAMAPMLPLVPSEVAATAHRILERAATVAAAEVGRERVVTSLARGSRVPRLVKAAEHASLVVLGREAHSGLERLVTGATTIGVAARAGVPTIAVPPGWEPGHGQARVVVGLKSTRHARGLLGRAFAEAALRDAELVIVHAWELASGYDDLIVDRVAGTEWAERIAHQIEEHLTEWRDRFPRVPVDVRVVHGQAAQVLREESTRAELLMLVRRLHGFPGGHLGGTGRLLLRESLCPVEVVPLGVGAGLEAGREMRVPDARGEALLK